MKYVLLTLCLATTNALAVEVQWMKGKSRAFECRGVTIEITGKPAKLLYESLNLFDSGYGKRANGFDCYKPDQFSKEFTCTFTSDQNGNLTGENNCHEP